MAELEDIPEGGFVRDRRANMPVYTIFKEDDPTLERGRAYYTHWAIDYFISHAGTLDRKVLDFEQTPQFQAYLEAYRELTRIRVKWTQARQLYMYYALHPEIIQRQITKARARLRKHEMNFVRLRENNGSSENQASVFISMLEWTSNINILETKLENCLRKTLELRELINAAWVRAEETYDTMIGAAHNFSVDN